MTTPTRIIIAGAALAVIAGAGSCDSGNPGPVTLADMATGTPDAAGAGPVVTQVAPAIGVNTGGTALVLTGTGFVSGATVTIGGVPATGVVVASATRINCTAPAKPKTCGRTPIVVTNPGGQTATAANLFSYKSGGFALAAAQSTPANSILTAGNLVAGDWNGDSNPDLVVVNMGAAGTASTVSLLLGQGTGAFGSPTTTPVGILPRGILAADVDGNKLTDVLVANSGSNSFTVLLNSGNGTLAVKGSTNAGIGANAVAVGDFDGDGKVDVAVANTGTVAAGGSVSVLLGNGDGTYKLPALTLRTGAMTNSVAVRDVNGDLKPDVVAASPSGLDVLLGNGNGTFMTSVQFLVGTAAASVGATDFDGDGKQDLFAINANTNNLSVLLNAGGTGTGLFGAPRIVASGGVSPVMVITTDLDGDGKADLATANATSNDVSVLLGNGNATFAAIPPLAVGTSPRSVVAADVNVDGNLDLVSANGTSANVSVLLSQCN